MASSIREAKTTRKEARGRFLRGPGVKGPVWGSTDLLEIRAGWEGALRCRSFRV